MALNVSYNTESWGGMLGECLCCKKFLPLTKHHNKDIKKIILICRNCHNVLEEYIKVQMRAENV